MGPPNYRSSGAPEWKSRLVMTFYDLCQDIWAGALATTRIEGTNIFVWFLSIMHWKRLV